MANSTVQHSNANEIKLDRYGVRFIVREFASTFLNLIILLISAGILGWINAWVCTGLILAYQIANISILHKLNPQLLNKRGRLLQTTTKLFDKIFVFLFIPLAYSLSVVAGLDAIRYEWSDIVFGLNLLGGIIFVLACILGIWAMAVNANFEMTVLTPDAEDQVCTSGPYKKIRHPGYIAEIIALISTPLILGSWFGFIPASTLIILFVIRTALEDKTLQQELPGYKEYSKITRYRLIPYLW